MSQGFAVNAHTPKRVLAAFVLYFLFTVGLGYTGFRLDGERWDNAVYKSLQLFHLHFYRGPEGDPKLVKEYYGVPKLASSPGPGTATAARASGESKKPPIHTLKETKPWSILNVARFFGALLALAWVPLILGMMFLRQIYTWWVGTFWQGHSIVAGEWERAERLVADLREKRQRVVFIGQSEHGVVEAPHGVLCLEGDARDPLLLKTARITHAARLVAIHDADRRNLEIITVAETLCRQRPESLPELECTAQVRETQVKHGLKEAVATLSRESRRFRAQLYNYHETVARILACQFPLPDAVVEETARPEHYIIVGFGSFGQSVALKLVKMGQQLVHYQDGGGLDGEWSVLKPRFTIVDPRGESALIPFLESNANFRELCTHLEVLECDCESPEFLRLDFLRPEDAEARTSIIFCLKDEDVVLRSTFEILERCRLVDKDVEDLYLRFGHPDRLEAIIAQLNAQSSKPRINFFAPDAQVYTEDGILRRSQDLLARMIHAHWGKADAADQRANNKPTASGRTWEMLSEADRDANRESADHSWAKLRTLGYQLQVVMKSQERVPAPPALLEALQTREEELARSEHYRWMTFRLLGGWRYGKERDPVKKEHPDLVPYEKLSEPVKDKDRIVVRAIRELLQSGDLRAEEMVERTSKVIAP